jgi:hypothetical protein
MNPSIEHTEAGNTNTAYAAAAGKKIAFPGTRRGGGAFGCPRRNQITFE